MKKRENRLLSFLAEYGICFLLFGAITIFCVGGMQSAEQKQQEEALRIAEESILRGAVSCYALEGFYPPDLNYLEEHYGVQINHRRYIVSYVPVAENLMPDIIVLEK